MELEQQIDLDELRQQVQTCFDSKILKRGWRYYLDGVVDELQNEGGKFYAIVYGAEAYEVKADLENVRRAHCDCPYGGYCKHIASRSVRSVR
ncbi:SWIM zinc finger family protein [Paenibacillus sp. P26]|nr:SWIM zinc finger family protein [Paenibacillus sp. P26]